jgi:hypothetical protein
LFSLRRGRRVHENFGGADGRRSNHAHPETFLDLSRCADDPVVRQSIHLTSSVAAWLFKWAGNDQVSVNIVGARSADVS